MRYYILAGEASGDIHAANLMKELKLLDCAAQFRFVGGNKMLHYSRNIFMHYKNINFMGFSNVLKNLAPLLKRLRVIKKDIYSYRPDVFIAVDSAGMNLRLCKYAKKQGIDTCFYILPKAWAWNSARAHALKRHVDLALSILPFEQRFFRKYGVMTNYVGNPVCDSVGEHSFDERFLERKHLNGKPLITLMPGSRAAEVRLMLPELVKLAPMYPEYQFVVAAHSNFSLKFYQNLVGEEEVKILFDKSYDLLKNSVAAVIKSGTSALEAALIGTPHIVVYKCSAFTYAVIKKIIKIKFISLINLLFDQEVVKELVQERFTAGAMKIYLDKILPPSAEHQALKSKYEELKKMLERGSARRAASAIITKFSN